MVGAGFYEPDAVRERVATGIEYVPASAVTGIRPGDWIETARPPRQVSEVLRYWIRFTDGTEVRKANA